MVENTTTVARNQPRHRGTVVAVEHTSGGFWSACTFMAKLGDPVSAQF
jgi:hypothetical protein